MTQTRKKEYSVPALDKCVAIMDLLLESQKLNIKEIQTRLKIPKTSVFVLLHALEKYQLIEKDDGGHYFLGSKSFHWGMDYYKRISVRKVARPFMQALVETTPYTCHLAVLMNNKPVYIDKVEGNGFIRFATTVGQSLPLHLSGVGKALASGLSDSEIEETLKDQMQHLTAKSPTRIKTILEEIEFVRTHGYSIEDEQMEEGIRCIGAPIYGLSENVIAAISLTSTSKELPAIKYREIGEAVKATALEISRNMGYPK